MLKHNEQNSDSTIAHLSLPARLAQWPYLHDHLAKAGNLLAKVMQTGADSVLLVSQALCSRAPDNLVHI